MKSIRSMTISTKLPLFVATVCLVLAFSLTAFTDYATRGDLVHAAEDELQRSVDARAELLDLWLEDVGNDLLPMKNSPATIDALMALRAGWMTFREDPTTYLQRAYIDENPNPVGQRQLLDRASEPLLYNLQHEKVHPYFRDFQEANGYYDLFLLNLEGDIIYSVFKEPDFGLNVLTSELSTSGIAQAYQSAAAGVEGVVYFSNFAPYAPSNGAVAAFASTLVKNAQGESLGVLIVQLQVNEIDVIMSGNGLTSDTFEAYLVADDLTLRSNPSEATGLAILDPLPDRPYLQAAVSGETHQIFRDVGLRGEPVIAASSTFNKDGVSWAIVAEDLQSTILAQADSLRRELILGSLIATIVTSFLGWLFVRSITRSIASIGDDMAQLSEGNYEINVPEAKRKDEIGAIGAILLDFRDRLKAADEAEQAREQQTKNLEVVVAELSSGLQKAADGNLTASIEQPFDASYETLRANFNDAMSELNKALVAVVQTAESIKTGALEISSASDDLSGRTENQAATLEQTAAAMDELTSSVRTAAESAQKVEQIVSDAQSEAQKSGDIVQDAVKAMSEIEKSSEQISQIIVVIEDIAFQTNLLALNAGVEAARAGEAGKGFAVVASEVRALAQRSSEAAKEIKVLIEGSTRQVDQGVDLVGKAGDALQNIVERVAHISQLMTGIASGAAEQATGLAEINIGVNQLDEVTQQNAAMVEEATAASHNLNADSDRLMNLVQKFQTSERRDSTQVVDMYRSHAQDSAPSETMRAESTSFDFGGDDASPVKAETHGSAMSNDAASAFADDGIELYDQGPSKGGADDRSESSEPSQPVRRTAEGGSGWQDF